MNIEQKIFSKYVIDENKLKKYGFKIKNKKLIFETNIFDGGFRVIIEYKEEITGKIFDLSTEEEYTNYRIESSNGFSSQIREEYIKQNKLKIFINTLLKNIKMSLSFYGKNFLRMPYSETKKIINGMHYSVRFL